MKKVVEWVRVSTEGQAAPDKYGVAGQQLINRRTCEIHGLEVVAVVTAIDVKGSDVVRSDEFARLMAIVRTPDISGVVLADLDRLFRPDDYRDIGILQEFRDRAKLLYLPDGPLDSDQALLVLVRTGMAADEKRKIKSRTWNAKEAKRRAGLHVGGSLTLPFGVTFCKRTGQWSYDGVNSKKVRAAFDMLLGGEHCLAKIARVLGIVRSNLRFILSNRIYTGWKVWNERRNPSNSAYVKRPAIKGYKPKISRAEHEVISKFVISTPLVSEAEFAEANRVLQVRSAVYRSRRAGPEAAFTTYRGFLRCGACGERLYTHNSQSGGFYVCKSRNTRERRRRAQRGLHACDNRYMLRSKVETAIDRLLSTTVHDNSFTLRAFHKFEQQSASETGKLKRDSQRRALALSEATKTRERILRSYWKGHIAEQQFEREIAEIEATIGEIELVERSNTASGGQLALWTMDDLRLALSELHDWSKRSKSDRRLILAKLGAEISVDQYVLKSLRFRQPQKDSGSSTSSITVPLEV